MILTTVWSIQEKSYSFAALKGKYATNCNLWASYLIFTTHYYKKVCICLPTSILAGSYHSDELDRLLPLFWPGSPLTYFDQAPHWLILTRLPTDLGKSWYRARRHLGKRWLGFLLTDNLWYSTQHDYAIQLSKVISLWYLWWDFVCLAFWSNWARKLVWGIPK